MTDSVMTERKVIIVWRDVQALHVAPWNPRTRINESTASFKDLLRSMRTHGFWWFMPILISPDNMIIDGHRRWTAAVRANLPTVPTLRLDIEQGELQELWGILNGTPLKTGSAALLEAVSQGFAPEYIVGRNVQSVVLRILDTGGMDFLNTIVSYRSGTYAFQLAEDIARICGRDGDKELIIAATQWMNKHGLQNFTRQLLDNPQANQAETFLQHIKDDTPIKRNFQ